MSDQESIEEQDAKSCKTTDSLWLCFHRSTCTQCGMRTDLLRGRPGPPILPATHGAAPCKWAEPGDKSMHCHYIVTVMSHISGNSEKMATFSDLERYKLTGVRVQGGSGSELGCGSYASIVQLDYMGLKCAGKKIHEQRLRSRGDDSYGVRRFKEECQIHSQLRHPNIVQFLGVHFQPDVPAPILVMEFLPTNLTSCIEQYDTLPQDINYSILHDVALALCYLHSQTPPIIHRDLSSNNVLLTPNMTAKISDFGKAKRLLENNSAGAQKLTRNPGTIDFMPPESFMANPEYDTCIDEFSYGVMMIHVLSGKWPSPQIGPTFTKPDGTMVAVTEADRRKVFLDGIGRDHPLMNLILKCVDNYPKARAKASEIVERLTEMVSQGLNRLEMQRLVEIQCCAEHKAEKKAFREKLEKKDQEIEELQARIKSISKVRRTAAVCIIIDTLSAKHLIFMGVSGLC